MRPHLFIIVMSLIVIVSVFVGHCVSDSSFKETITGNLKDLRNLPDE